MRNPYRLQLILGQQRLLLFANDSLEASYLVSTGLKGIGEEEDSEKTPRGRHEICEKVGEGAAVNTIFQYRQPTGELYTPYLRQQQERDWILTRILRLSGLEEGRNKGGKVDTYRRCIYFHGAPDEAAMGIPASRGCIRMHNWDIIQLFERIPVGTIVEIEE